MIFRPCGSVVENRKRLDLIYRRVFVVNVASVGREMFLLQFFFFFFSFVFVSLFRFPTFLPRFSLGAHCMHFWRLL